jgi:hypothetical protein
MEETTRYFVAASYPFDNANAWDCKTKEEAIKLFEELKKQVIESDNAVKLEIKDRQRDYRVIEYFVNRRQMFGIDELNDYENTLIAWDE